MVSLPSSTPAPSYSAVSSSSDLKVPSSFAALDQGMLRAVGMCPARTDIRAFRDEVIAAIGEQNLIDVRSPDEFSGKLLAPAHLPQEQSQRAGHIPTARNIPWSKAANDDGTFRSDDELTALYEGAG